MSPFRVLTPADAGERLRHRRGYQVQDGTGCFIAADDERAPNGQGSWLAYYEAKFGTVPAGMTIRFLCSGKDRGCVRPTHMEAIPEGARVTRVERPAPVPPRLARLLGDERDARRMSTAEFAAELKVKPSALAAWIGGRAVPDQRTLAWIGKHLGWDGQPRKWRVIFIQERFVTATSSGDAVRVVWDEIDASSPEAVRKTAIHSVSEAGGRRGGRVG